MAPQPLDEIGPPDDDPRLRAAEQLVAGERDEIRSGREACTCRGLVADVHERTGAEIVDERQLVTTRDVRELLQRRLLREADDAEVGLVNA